jgi:hypothetical protein
MTEQTIIYEAELSPADLEPSPAFARLVGRVGRRAGIGTLGIGAMQELIRERASENRPPSQLADDQATSGESATAI